MNQHLVRLISDYQESVRHAIELLEKSGVPRPVTNTEWVGLDIAHVGKLEGGFSYRKHGYGCEVDLPGGRVDFDFGENGEIDGFDTWRLCGFAGKRLATYGFSNEAELKTSFDDAVSAGSLVYSGYLLYYTA